VSAAALLIELEQAGVRLSLAGDDLHYQTQPGVSTTPHRARIRESKPALLAELRAREEFAAMGLDPSLHWVSVYTGPVEASIAPERWDGRVAARCAVPNACYTLGSCPHFKEHGQCWNKESTP
jgi:hypothetical protein